MKKRYHNYGCYENPAISCKVNLRILNTLKTAQKILCGLVLCVMKLHPPKNQHAL